MKPKDTNVKASRPVKARRDEKGGARSAQEGNCVVTREGLARVLDVSVRTVDRMRKKGKITPLDLESGLVRYHVAEVIAGLSQHQQKFEQENAEKTEGGPRNSQSPISDSQAGISNLRFQSQKHVQGGQTR